VVSHIEDAFATIKQHQVCALIVSSGRSRRPISDISLCGKKSRSWCPKRCGAESFAYDSATFQGTERDIVYLSMVADAANKTALTMLRYEQRFNVAVSRARDPGENDMREWKASSRLRRSEFQSACICGSGERYTVNRRRAEHCTTESPRVRGGRDLASRG